MVEDAGKKNGKMVRGGKVGMPWKNGIGLQKMGAARLKLMLEKVRAKNKITMMDFCEAISKKNEEKCCKIYVNMGNVLWDFNEKQRENVWSYIEYGCCCYEINYWFSNLLKKILKNYNLFFTLAEISQFPIN